MTKLLGSVAVLGVLSVSSLALAGGIDATPVSDDQGVYVGVHGGASIPGGADSDFVENGYNLGVQVGYRFNKYFRAEGAFDYMRNNLKWPLNAIHQNIYTAMANVYAGIRFNDSPVEPFVGAGIGYLGTNISGFGETSNTEDYFAYQGIVGVAFHATSKISIDAKYRILGVTNGSGHVNAVEAGISYAI